MKVVVSPKVTKVVMSGGQGPQGPQGPAGPVLYLSIEFLLTSGSSSFTMFNEKNMTGLTFTYSIIESNYWFKIQNANWLNNYIPVMSYYINGAFSQQLAHVMYMDDNYIKFALADSGTKKYRIGIILIPKN